MNKDVLYLVWTDTAGNKYKVAELSKENNEYSFRYILDELKQARQKGFEPFIAFPRIDAIYHNPNLFAVFAARLPDEKRPEIGEILKTYNMESYDEFELLKRSRGKLPTDNYEFMQQLL